MPIALTLMRTSAGPGAGTTVSTSSRTSGPPTFVNLMVRDIGAPQSAEGVGFAPTFGRDQLMSFAAIDVEDVAGNERRLVRCDEDDRVGELLREAEATHRNSRDESRLVLRSAREAGQHAGVRRTRRHGIHPDARLDDLEGNRLGDAFDGVLATNIDRGPRRTFVPVGRGDVDDAAAALSL